MNITFITDGKNPQREHQSKFIVIGDVEGKVYCIFFPSRFNDHSSLVLDSELLLEDGDVSSKKFIGAGYYGITWDGRSYFFWDSTTCKMKYGYDRPSDNDIASKIGEEIKKYLIL
jgi:hypothetical protein